MGVVVVSIGKKEVIQTHERSSPMASTQIRNQSAANQERPRASRNPPTFNLLHAQVVSLMSASSFPDFPIHTPFYSSLM